MEKILEKRHLVSVILILDSAQTNEDGSPHNKYKKAGETDSDLNIDCPKSKAKYSQGTFHS